MITSTILDRSPWSTETDAAAPTAASPSLGLDVRDAGGVGLTPAGRARRDPSFLDLDAAGGLGCPPPLRGSDLRSLTSWSIACRASAAVLQLEGHPERAAHLRQLAEAAERRSARLLAAATATLVGDVRPTAA